MWLKKTDFAGIILLTIIFAFTATGSYAGGLQIEADGDYGLEVSTNDQVPDAVAVGQNVNPIQFKIRRDGNPIKTGTLQINTSQPGSQQFTKDVNLTLQYPDGPYDLPATVKTDEICVAELNNLQISKDYMALENSNRIEVDLSPTCQLLQDVKLKVKNRNNVKIRQGTSYDFSPSGIGKHKVEAYIPNTPQKLTDSFNVVRIVLSIPHADLPNQVDAAVYATESDNKSLDSSEVELKYKMKSFPPIVSKVRTRNIMEPDSDFKLYIGAPSAVTDVFNLLGSIAGLGISTIADAGDFVDNNTLSGTSISKATLETTTQIKTKPKEIDENDVGLGYRADKNGSFNFQVKGKPVLNIGVPYTLYSSGSIEVSNTYAVGSMARTIVRAPLIDKNIIKVIP